MDTANIPSRDNILLILRIILLKFVVNVSSFSQKHTNLGPGLPLYPVQINEGRPLIARDLAVVDMQDENVVTVKDHT